MLDWILKEFLLVATSSHDDNVEIKSLWWISHSIASIFMSLRVLIHTAINNGSNHSKSLGYGAKKSNINILYDSKRICFILDSFHFYGLQLRTSQFYGSDYTQIEKNSPMSSPYFHKLRQVCAHAMIGINGWLMGCTLERRWSVCICVWAILPICVC